MKWFKNDTRLFVEEKILNLRNKIFKNFRSQHISTFFLVIKAELLGKYLRQTLKP